MNACSIPLDNYLKCLNEDTYFIKNSDDDSKHKRCKYMLIEYNNCVLGKGKWKEHHEKFENSKLLINLNAEKKHSFNNNSDKKIFTGEKFILNNISRYND